MIRSRPRLISLDRRAPGSDFTLSLEAKQDLDRIRTEFDATMPKPTTGTDVEIVLKIIKWEKKHHTRFPFSMLEQPLRPEVS